MLCTAAVLCSLALFQCQAIPLGDDFAREVGFAPEVEAMIEQETKGKMNIDSYCKCNIIFSRYHALSFISAYYLVGLNTRCKAHFA